MRNLKFLVMALALVIGISSCKKEEKASTNSTAIVGKWIFTKEAVKDYRNGVIFRDTVYTNSTSGYTEFKADGTGVEFKSNGNTQNFTYNLQNDGKKLIYIEYDGDKEEYDIKLLNKSNLVLYFEEAETEDGVSYKYISEYTFNRK